MLLVPVRFPESSTEAHLRSIARCLKVFCAVILAAVSIHAQAGAKAPDKDLLELEHYTLTMDKVTRCMQTLADFKKLSKANPQMEATLKTDPDKDESITQITQRISGFPQVVTIIQSHGFATREFVVLELTVFQSAFAVAAKKMGADAAKLSSQAHVNPDNIIFMEQHQAEFEELQKKYPLGDD
jgi:hypothetical protein